MANNVVQPGQMQEPGELLDPEKGSRFEQYKVDGVARLMVYLKTGKLSAVDLLMPKVICIRVLSNINVMASVKLVKCSF